MRRRTFLAGTGLAATLGTAGCAGLFESDAGDAPQEPPLVEDRPDAVYLPTHTEGMEMVGMAEDGRYRFALSYSFPHRFWLLTGDRRRQVDVTGDDSIHLMVSAWDGDTDTHIPSSAASVTIVRDDEPVVEGSLWEMLSQNMGAHYGDNIVLPEEGTYDVSLSFGPAEPRMAGALAGAFEESGTASFELPFEQSTLRTIPFQEFPERQGERASVDPMAMDMVPSGQLPPATDMPGRLLGEAESGDAAVVAVALDDVPAGIDSSGVAGDGTYLAVSPRTPYNRFPLPTASLSATVERGGDAVFDGALQQTLHEELGYHYGAVVSEVADGDALEVRFDAPPRLGRHEGYETAFLSLDPVSIEV